ncbi:MAG: 2-amino-4-hydroxy-6-hydroxymethyldihydropteridine diphosphokinase [Candidatus Mcinerneyibacterium aminivorans]|uniref:2-amino-4-hydroxy-6-hydroxymethyldihydropteridine diphosphokinase n=1 Tax=Candidatus Mcinerneyibacterium aminivorans TaxID=2703815 RepID=A0A5D0MFZ3_9BACT|nr:MAG: 2-amino-4-hydroxy-6-hydroxymethyldihydropteridine diphosphokinase [Candidatus Mcinerneyibacterium aminivorans]
MFNEIYLGIGTNKGDRLGNIQKLIKKLKKSGIIYLDAVSSLYESKPVGYKEQQNFYNMVIKGRTRLNSRSLLEYVKKIEYEMGRRWSKKNHPRIIDVDILFYGDQVIDENSLKIPHNKIYERDFVLIPLVELESDFHDPTNYRLLKDFIKNPDSLKKVRDKKELL